MKMTLTAEHVKKTKLLAAASTTEETGMVLIAHRLPVDLLAQVDAAAKGWDDTRSRALRRLIQVGLDHCHGPA